MYRHLKKIMLYLEMIWNIILYRIFGIPKTMYYFKCGVIHFEMEKYGTAISFFNKSEDSEDGEGEYENTSKYNWYYLGYCYLNLGDFKRVVQYLTDYVKLCPNDFDTISIIAWCHELLLEPEMALQYYKRLIKLQPDAFELYFECSTILSDMGRKDEAVKQLAVGKEKIPPGDIFSRKVAESILYRIKGDLKHAVETLQEAISTTNSISKEHESIKADLLKELARLQIESGDLEGGLSTLEEACQKKQPEIWLANDLAFEYAEQQIKLEKAIELIEYALKYQPFNSQFLDTKAWILFKMGKLEEAKVTIQQSIELNSNNKTALNHHDTISGRT